MADKAPAIADCELTRRSLTDLRDIDVEIARLSEDCEIVAERVRSLVKENSSTAQSQEEYLKKYDNLNKRYEDFVCELEKQKEERTSRQQKDKAMSMFIRALKKNPHVLDEWDDTIWTVMVEKGIVGRNGGIRFVFFNGMEIEVRKE
jgi:predicted nuclease with TOPRIM domain